MVEPNSIINGFNQLTKSTVNNSSQMLHLGSIFISLLFNDPRGLILFFGLLTNSFLNLGMKYLFSSSPSSIRVNEFCEGCGNFFSSCYNNNGLPAENVQTFTFFATFIISIMYFNNNFRLISFFTLLGLLVIICYTNIYTGCNSLSQILVGIAFGIIFGILYALMVNGIYYPDKDDKDLSIFPVIKEKLKKSEENKKKYVCKAYKNGIEIDHV